MEFHVDKIMKYFLEKKCNSPLWENGSRKATLITCSRVAFTCHHKTNHITTQSSLSQVLLPPQALHTLGSRAGLLTRHYFTWHYFPPGKRSGSNDKAIVRVGVTAISPAEGRTSGSSNAGPSDKVIAHYRTTTQPWGCREHNHHSCRALSGCQRLRWTVTLGSSLSFCRHGKKW